MDTSLFTTLRYGHFVMTDTSLCKMTLRYGFLIYGKFTEVSYYLLVNVVCSNFVVNIWDKLG